MGSIIAITFSIVLLVIIWNSFKKDKATKKLQKATKELENLKKLRTELEKKLDALEDLEKSKKCKRKGKLSK